MNCYQEVRFMLHVFYSIAQLNTKARQFGFLGLLLPVGLRKFSTNNNEEVVYRWTNGFEGYRDLPGAKACNTKPQNSTSPIYIDDTGDARANARFYSCKL